MKIIPYISFYVSLFFPFLERGGRGVAEPEYLDANMCFERSLTATIPFMLVAGG